MLPACGSMSRIAVLAPPARSVPAPLVGASEVDPTPVAGVALWGSLLDRLNVVAWADRRGVRPIGPGGYTGGECYRALVETQLAGGDLLDDRVLLADPASAALRGGSALPSVSTSWRYPGRRGSGPGAQGGGGQPVAAAPVPAGWPFAPAPGSARISTGSHSCRYAGAMLLYCLLYTSD